MSDKKIEELIEENAKLKSELSSLKKVVNSKRFKTANKAANYFNQLFPVTSRRRRVVNSILNFSKKNGVDVIRTLKIIKLLKNNEIISNVEAINACTLLIENENTRIPKNDIDDLINEFKRDTVTN